MRLGEPLVHMYKIVVRFKDKEKTPEVHQDVVNYAWSRGLLMLTKQDGSVLTYNENEIEARCGLPDVSVK